MFKKSLIIDIGNLILGNEYNVGDLILINGCLGIFLGYAKDYIDFLGYRALFFSYFDLKDYKEYWCSVTKANIEKIS